jgi:hypothetical protein
MGAAATAAMEAAATTAVEAPETGLPSEGIGSGNPAMIETAEGAGMRSA